MNKPILLASVLFASFSFQAAATQFEVTIQNLTKGQPITPPVLVAHSPKIQLFKVGEEASQGLKELAQDGVTSTLETELNSSAYVKGVNTGSGVILPGQKQTITLKSTSKKVVLSFVSMLARTNDAIVAAKNLPLRIRKGHSYVVLANVYDAGAEQNNESCSSIPAPPCNNPGVGTDGGEGFVRPHEGVLGIADLDLTRDTFASKAAKITIKRVD
ncbi:MAG: spondin domain-containing protein [Halobacteriovoraceae bacterium]|nr:spondin domain-containing protein [Halobacteriovoraceae bacterium]